MLLNAPHDQPLAQRWRVLLLAALGVSVGSFLVNEVCDFDIWWQVAIGRDILAHGAVPVVDRFAAAALGRPYHDSHWIFQVLMALADRLGGMVGVQLVMIALWMAILWCCGRACARWVPALYAVPLLFLAAMASSERFIPRPELITFLGIACFYWRLQEGRYGTRRDLALLALTQLLWSNGHGLFVLGPFLVGCYWLVAALGGAERRRAELPALSKLLGVVLVTTLITPYGWHSWRYALLLFQEAGPNAPKLLKEVGELSPTFGAANLSGVAFWFFLALLLLTVSLTLWGLLRKQRIATARLLIVVVMFALALTGRRNMVLFALVAAPFGAELLGQLAPRRPPYAGALAGAAALLLVAWSWYPLSGNYYQKIEWPNRTGFGATSSSYPHGLPAFLDRIGFTGQAFNSNWLGGFYLYHGYPQRIPFTDGRWEVYDPATFEEIAGIARSPAAWQAFADRHGVSGVLLHHTSGEAKGLLPLLRGEPRWRLVYLDAAASFWVRSADYPLAPALDLSSPGTLPATARLDDALILDLFLQRVGADQLRALNLERALGFGQQRDRLLASLGATQQQLGRYDAARQAFERLHREDPRSLVALNELAFLAFERGDLAQAESWLLKALEVAPDSADARANLQRVRAAKADAGSRSGQ